jgi:hypothetical protein
MDAHDWTGYRIYDKKGWTQSLGMYGIALHRKRTARHCVCPENMEFKRPYTRHDNSCVDLYPTRSPTPSPTRQVPTRCPSGRPTVNVAALKYASKAEKQKMTQKLMKQYGGKHELNTHGVHSKIPSKTKIKRHSVNSAVVTSKPPVAPSRYPSSAPSPRSSVYAHAHWQPATQEPTSAPTAAPTLDPSPVPTTSPTTVPTVAPTASPTTAPTISIKKATKHAIESAKRMVHRAQNDASSAAEAAHLMAKRVGTEATTAATEAKAMATKAQAEADNARESLQQEVQYMKGAIKGLRQAKQRHRRGTRAGFGPSNHGHDNLQDAARSGGSGVGYGFNESLSPSAGLVAQLSWVVHQAQLAAAAAQSQGRAAAAASNSNSAPSNSNSAPSNLSPKELRQRVLLEMSGLAILSVAVLMIVLACTCGCLCRTLFRWCSKVCGLGGSRGKEGHSRGEVVPLTGNAEMSGPFWGTHEGLGEWAPSAVIDLDAYIIWLLSFTLLAWIRITRLDPRGGGGDVWVREAESERD